MDFARDRVNRLISRNTKILLGLFAIASVADILQAVGYSTPGWIVFSGTNDENVTFSAGVGLWYQRVCTADICETGHIVGEVLMSEAERKQFKTSKLVATVAVVFSLFSPINILVYIRRVRRQLDITTIAGSAVLMCLCSGVVGLVVVSMIANEVHTGYALWLKTESTDFKLGLLYSELLMGLGAALDCLTAIGLCIQIYYRKRYFRDSGQEEDFRMSPNIK